MERNLILDVQADQISIAQMEDGRLMEFCNESRTAAFTVGNIYLAKVKKVMPGLNASFVEVGYEKEGFLHYLDLGLGFSTVDSYLQGLRASKKQYPMSKVQFKPDLPKDGSISDYLKPGQELMVQVVKEPISTKGPRLTTEISLAGRSLVLMPFATKVSVSQKIKDSAERNRLRKEVQAFKPRNYGVIVRTVAEGRTGDELKNELEALVKRWEDALQRVKKAKTYPALVVEEIGRTEAILRDHLNAEFTSIHINDQGVYDEVRSYLEMIEPAKAGLVKFYQDRQPIFDVYNITRQIKAAFGRVVSMKKGAYLVIEHTEAFHVIDVNSGTRTKSGNEQEDTAFEVNMMAVDEVARQMRLRDMGGIVVIDLIDMHSSEHRKQVFDRMSENMKNDSARHNVLPLSKFCLMQITRQRVRPVTLVDTSEQCPTCHGAGKIRSSLLFTDMLESKIDLLTANLHITRASLFVHPYVYAYIKRGLPSLALRWRMRYGWGIRVYPNQSFAFLQYEFRDKDGNRIELSDPHEMAE